MLNQSLIRFHLLDIMSKIDSQSRESVNEEKEVSESVAKRARLDESIENSSTYPILRFMPMKNGSENVKNLFKSPFVNRVKVSTASTSPNSNKTLVFNSPIVLNKNADPNKLKQEIASMQQELDECEEEIGMLNEANYEVEYLDLIIEKLHEYNDVKDTAQTLLERVAHVKGDTIKAMHEFYGIDFEND